MTLKSMSAASPARIEGSAIQSLPVGMTSSGASVSFVSVSAASEAGIAAAPVAIAADRNSAIKRRMRVTLFPLDRTRRLGGVIVDHAIDAVDLIHDAGRDAAQEFGVEWIDVGGHAIERGDRAKRTDIIVGAIVAHHPDRAHRH